MKRKSQPAKRRVRKMGEAKPVTLVCRPNGCFVVPPEERVSKRQHDEIVWRGNNTGGKITFPTTLPFGWLSRTFSRGGSLYSGPVVAGCPAGEYEYSAYCTDCQKKGTRRLAIGRSNPKVIVDP